MKANSSAAPRQKTLLYAALIALVVGIVAVIALIISLSNDPPAADLGSNMGDSDVEYYCEFVDGEVLLTFKSNYAFILSGPGINKTGTYYVNDNTVHLDYFRDEDGTTTATLSGDSLALIYADATLTFAKKIEYTVTFDTDGGTQIASRTVYNGQTVKKPQSPTKQGYQFLGWYADDECTVKFDFTTTAIKGDTVIYARWAEDPFGT